MVVLTMALAMQHVILIMYSCVMLTAMLWLQFAKGQSLLPTYDRVMACAYLSASVFIALLAFPLFR